MQGLNLLLETCIIIHIPPLLFWDLNIFFLQFSWDVIILMMLSDNSFRFLYGTMELIVNHLRDPFSSEYLINIPYFFWQNFFFFCFVSHLSYWVFSFLLVQTNLACVAKIKSGISFALVIESILMGLGQIVPLMLVIGRPLERIDMLSISLVLWGWKRLWSSIKARHREAKGLIGWCTSTG